MRGELHVFDRDFSWQGVVDYSTLEATRVHLGVSAMEYTTASDLDVRAALAAPGAWSVFMLDGEQFVVGQHDVSGSFAPGADLTYTVTGAFDVLYGILGIPVPTAGAAGQNVAYWRTSPARRPAESAFKAVLSANVARLGLPITVAPDLGRGDDIELSYRFHPLPDRFLAQMAGAGIGIDVTLVEGQGLRVDCYEATTHTVPLTAGDGVITGGSWSRKRPTASRAWGLADGEGVDRNVYGPFIDVSREAEFGFMGEVAVDARDTSDGPTVSARLLEVIREHDRKVSVSLELTESADFAYGPYRVGDRVPVLIPDSAVPAVDTLTEATVTHSREVPEPEVTFHLGDKTDTNSAAVWRAISAVAATTRDLTVT